MPTTETAAAAGYFAMGGYAEYVWGAYGIAAIALCGLLAWAVLRTRALEREAAALRRSAPADEDFQ